ncbi:MAG: hypothetical protein RMI92_07385 [Geminocystis sp.]|nr:hypothetical protein [Geminocystis sp.]MDW8116241.1 hypothetical protein [Geminocystis sp.]MDW8462767.1 hypothetical protein [Geminocystis sp.]
MKWVIISHGNIISTYHDIEREIEGKMCMAIQFCLRCKNTGIILEKRPSEYPGSYDYYPVPCPYCEKGKTIAREREKKSRREKNPPLSHL